MISSLIDRTQNLISTDRQIKSEIRSRSRLPQIICMSVLLAACGGESAPPEPKGPKLIKLMTVGGDVQGAAREFPGQAKATRAADLSFRVSGVLQKFPAQEGQQVQEGALVAKLDPRDFETGVTNVEGSLEVARAQMAALRTGARPEEVARLEADVQARQAVLTEVQLRFDRFKELVDAGAISRQEFDQVKAERDVAAQDLEASNQALEAGQSGARQEDIDAQEARIRSLEADQTRARDALADTELRAPFSGIIARTYVENFEEVKAKQNILRIQDSSKIEIVINISESDLARAGEARMTIEEVAARAEGKVRFTAYPDREFPVTLQSFETEADPETQTFEVTMIMDQPDDARIQPGMNAIVVGSGKLSGGASGSIFVPLHSIFADSAGQKNLWVVDPSTQQVQARPVEADQMSGDRIRITQGLSPGEIIAISAVHSLREGMEVAPMPELGDL